MNSETESKKERFLRYLDQFLEKFYVKSKPTLEEDETVARRREFISNIRTAIVLIAVPAFIYYLCTVIFASRYPDVVTICAGIIMPVILFLLPTYVNRQINVIRERIGKNLNNSNKVYHESLELLKWVGTSPRTKFYYTSATPYFGLYKSFAKDKETFIDNEWRKLLEKRMAAAMKDPSIETHIYSLKWEPFTSGRSALFELCKLLAKSSKNKNTNRTKAINLYKTSILHWIDFIKILQKTPSPSTKVFISNSKHEVFAFWAEKEDTVRSVFSIVVEGCEHFRMFGSSSIYDELWTNMAKNALDSRKINSSEITHILLKDTRTRKQISRDTELLVHFTDLSDNYHPHSQLQKIKLPEYIFSDGNCFKYYINKYVFPFNVSKCSKLWPVAIEQLKLNIGDRLSVGVDINTGCGILALHLSTICSQVFATESDSKAMGNAILNYNKFKIDEEQIFTNKSDVLFYCCNSINTIPQKFLYSTFETTKQEPCFVITLQYLFYDSLFCTMDYTFSYNDTIPSNCEPTNADEIGECSACDSAQSPKFISREIKLNETLESLHKKLSGEIYIITPLNTELVTDFNVINMLNKFGYTNLKTLKDEDDNTNTLLIFHKKTN